MSEFKIAAAQVASVRGDIDANIATHLRTVASAASRGVSVLVFPELSLTGYEPDLAGKLAIETTDSRLGPLRSLARQHRIDVVVGVPLSNGMAKPNLGAILFTGDGATTTYSKITLGGNEPEFFAPGSAPLTFIAHGQRIGIAICADASRASHPRACAALGSTIYAASVFLNAEWYAADMPRLASYSVDYRTLVVMANHAASVGTLTSCGGSALWDPAGVLLAQAEGAEDCLVVATSRHKTWRGEVVRL